MKIKVKNIHGTSDKKCKCESWLKHWNNYSDRKVPLYCISTLCINKVSVGGHIRKTEGNDKEYIIPICDACNAIKKEYAVLDGYFVSADINETCEKKVL